LPVSAHTNGRENRDIGGLLVDPRLDNGAIKDQPNDVFIGKAAGAPRLPVGLDLAPGAAHHILAHRPLKQSEQGSLHPTRVGARKINSGDQGFGLFRQPLIAWQSLRSPFFGLAVLARDPRTRHAHGLRSKCTDQLPLAVSVAITGLCLAAAAIPATAQKLFQFLLENGLDRGANIQAQPVLDWIIANLIGQ